MKKNGDREAEAMSFAIEPWRLTLDHASDDAQVDALLSYAVRRVSSVYWTPVRVARRAARLFEELGVSRVLDVGSGPGKFCVVAGLHAPRLQLVGVEHRPHLVAAARALAASVRATNVTFVHGDATGLPREGFDGFYVFNSFAENSFSSDDQFDQTVELSRVRRVDDVMRMERGLAAQDEGTVLLTYHGLGGPIPGSYEPVHVEIAGSGWLRAWQKGSFASSKYWLEDGPDVRLTTIEEVVRHILPDPDESR